MYINETCIHYCGDEDCAKCDSYGILVGGCAGCRNFEDSVRNCNNCKHYKIEENETIKVSSCESWECNYEPKDKDEEERMSIWAN